MIVEAWAMLLKTGSHIDDAMLSSASPGHREILSLMLVDHSCNAVFLLSMPRHDDVSCTDLVPMPTYLLQNVLQPC